MCQNRVIRSRSGCGGEDHPVEPDPLEPRQARPTAPSRAAIASSSASNSAAGWPSPLVGSPSSSRSTLAVGPVAPGRARGSPRGRRTRPGGAGGPPAARSQGSSGRRLERRPGAGGVVQERGSCAWRRRGSGVGRDHLAVEGEVRASSDGRESGRARSDRSVGRWPRYCQEPRARRPISASAWALSFPFSSMFCMTSRARFLHAAGRAARRRPRHERGVGRRRRAPSGPRIRSRARPRLELRMKWSPTCATDGLKLCREWTGSPARVGPSRRHEPRGRDRDPVERSPSRASAAAPSSAPRPGWPGRRTTGRRP